MIHSGRHFSTAQPLLKNPEGAAPEGSKSGFLEIFWKYLYVNASVAIVFVAGWLFYKGSTWMSGFSLATFFKIGFTSGFVCAMAVAVLVSAASSAFRINKDTMFRFILKKLREEHIVCSRLGDEFKTGDFIATSRTGGFLSKVKTWRDVKPANISMEPRRMQMMFQVSGPTGASAMVSVDAFKSTTFSQVLSYRSIAVDFDNGDRHIVVGTEADVIYKGIVKLR
jgi:hypothetical protein|eukprot:CAMPEP_0174374682 /NCGR_PEP_ID=MMETSP0811_2-20130205/111792_1 /TAXON_ID=73025 ORGANISM="Eutreptiella gymnastica-like, Strain CCMP1594" /NCGR_SAMPLE_ID=MMETSP0811_2 /ASSEMBLY_ACC=CAM_ASM_000667 /LENGTH=223 /DNA_ID=CAMNT_0015524209 /DNA_START=187 /DNA_END=858 /DNA_ORIENTATION=+